MIAKVCDCESRRDTWFENPLVCRKSHCIHILWCIFMGLGHNDPWVESHMWPQQMWGQRSSRGQWPLVQVVAKTVTVSTYFDVFSGETSGSRTTLLYKSLDICRKTLIIELSLLWLKYSGLILNDSTSNLSFLADHKHAELLPVILKVKICKETYTWFLKKDVPMVSGNS